MTPQALVEAFYQHLWNEQDPAHLTRLLAPDFRFRGSLGLEKRGPDAFWDYVQHVVTPLGDYRCDIVDLVVDGHRAFARMWFSGIHRGPLLGFEATHERVGWSGAALFDCADGQIQSLWVLGDLDGLRMALAGPAG